MWTVLKLLEGPTPFRIVRAALRNVIMNDPSSFRTCSPLISDANEIGIVSYDRPERKLWGQLGRMAVFHTVTCTNLKDHYQVQRPGTHLLKSLKTIWASEPPACHQ
jgi:hypothetical protein